MTELERALTDLQTAIRRKVKPDERAVSSGKIPDDLARPDARMLSLTAEQHAAMDAVASAISADARFEHLTRRVDEVVWRFVCQAHLDRSRSLVGEFLTQHGEPLLHLTCYFGIENLTCRQAPRAARASPDARRRP
jgi:hypothetical protein